MFLEKDSKVCVTVAEQIGKSTRTEFLLMKFSITREQLTLPLVFPPRTALFWGVQFPLELSVGYLEQQ